ncbi:hypothetical protein QN277_023656 [Acacia crassicarpa]|uniref:C2 domain-containing protein n=1 Tax=Acacia crassicarpa TaxID=499986 RepID=A0AAE1K8B2_9FABA|nr:hypothetical protein QN277_023656 [Acacia crassicarpa]KAK4266782.1 hypothetical protein QN277_023656 [Acacia crassicarpa]
MDAIKKPRTLEVTVISGESLCIDQTPVTENVYVVVRAESLKCWNTKPAKQEVGTLSSLWNEKLMVEVPLHAQSITFEVQCKTPRGMVRSVGLARIGIWDVIPKEDKCLEMLSYRLRNWEGRRSGIINFSVKVASNKEQDTEKELKDSKMMVNSGDLKAKIIGVDHQDMNANNHNDNNGHVMGIPVNWWNYVGIRV